MIVYVRNLGHNCFDELKTKLHSRLCVKSTRVFMSSQWSDSADLTYQFFNTLRWDLQSEPNAALVKMLSAVVEMHITAP